MIVFSLASLVLTDLFSEEELVAFMMGALIPAAGFVLAAGRRQQDQTLLFYGGYMLALLGAFLAQSLFKHGVSGGRTWDVVGDLVQVPYAWFYLRFVRHYFRLETFSVRWSAWSRWLEYLYVVPVVLMVPRVVTGVDISAWSILVLNMVNLLGSYALAFLAWHRKREDAGWFLLAVLPLALAGLLHGLQWALEPGGSSINGLFPFWLGIVLQMLLFLLALGLRYQRLGQRLAEEEEGRKVAEREAVRLAAVNQTKDEYATFLSHEVRTPLNGLLGVARLLNETTLGSDQREQVRTIQTVGRLMLGLVDSMLDMAKIEAGVTALRREAVDLRAMARDVLALLQPQADWKRLELSLDVGGDVPERVAADDLRLRQILINLVANAVHYTAVGKIVVRIARLEDGRLEIAVRDTGAGIPVVKQSQLFKQFGRTSDADHGGGGLGLVIARRLTQLMNGELNFETTPGQGSVFTLRVTAAAWQGPGMAPSESKGRHDV